jgi:hypothetical protein
MEILVVDEDFNVLVVGGLWRLCESESRHRGQALQTDDSSAKLLRVAFFWR